jgi:hypothetical protein
MSEDVECLACEGCGEVETADRNTLPCPLCMKREHEETITRLTSENEKLRSMTVVQETLIRKVEAGNEKLRAAVERALRQLADGNRVLATGTLADAL